MTTIYDVAARAGVSPATVSRVFNGGNVSPEKARAVRRAAEKLAYTPNRAARALRRQTSDVIALVVTDIENPFFTAMARGVEEVALAAGFSVVLCNSDGDLAREARYFDIAIAEHMAGVVLVPAEPATDVGRLVEHARPVVTVDRGLPLAPVDSVVADDLTGGRQGTGALYDKGFTRVGCITGPRGAETAEKRSGGWREVFAQRSPGSDPREYVVHADYRVNGGRRAMADLLALNEPPDAVFVANNLMAVGALEALHQHGLRPPGFGMAVVGDVPYAPLALTGMDVVPLPARLIGATAAQVLLERIRGDSQPVRTIVLRHELPELENGAAAGS